MTAAEKYGEAYFTSDDEPNDYGPDLPYDWEHREGQMKATLADIERLCLPFKTVLDAGCGTGLLVRAMLQKGYKAQGVDISRWAVMNADEKARAHLWHGDIGDMPWLEDRAFDLVVCMDTLEHLEPNGIGPALDEMFRVANREVILRMPCARPLEWLATPDPGALKGPTGDGTHMMVVSTDFWEWEIARRGWLLSSRVHNVNLCMLSRTTYFVARNPEYQFEDK
jgi:SAM-dependent methyltransferase